MEYSRDIRDPQGRPIKLSSYQKNKLYATAKEQRKELKDRLCTSSECKKATGENVRKMINSEFSCKDMQGKYAKAMQAIGADPKDCSVENLRKRR